MYVLTHGVNLILQSGVNFTSAAGDVLKFMFEGGTVWREVTRHLTLSPLTTHEAASDPHTGYRLESADHTHASTGLQAGTIAHSALTGLAADGHTQYALDTDLTTHAAAADPHTGYVKESDASWIDLTDLGATTLHSHAGAAGATSMARTFALMGG